MIYRYRANNQSQRRTHIPQLYVTNQRAAFAFLCVDQMIFISVACWHKQARWLVDENYRQTSVNLCERANLKICPCFYQRGWCVCVCVCVFTHTWIHTYIKSIACSISGMCVFQWDVWFNHSHQHTHEYIPLTCGIARYVSECMGIQYKFHAYLKHGLLLFCDPTPHSYIHT